MQNSAEQTLSQALDAFEWGGEVLEAARYGEGHINDTFRVTARHAEGGRSRYILQRINTSVFRDAAALMENIAGVTEYLRAHIAAEGGDPFRETLNLLPTRAGNAYCTDAAGGAWRVYRYVEGTVCLQAAETAEQFRESARIFGRFQRLLAGYPAHTLHETIPHFHDTPRRYAALEEVAAADPLLRAAGVSQELAFVRARRNELGRLTQAQCSGELPLRVTHNDTKLNNVLMDASTGRALCVIDLDTVMPGVVANDFGDSIRFGANRCAEDEPDTNKVQFDLHLYEAYANGYLETAGDSLSPAERVSLPWGARLMTLECGIRFLTDYLDGDRYFKTSRPGQNLDRCRTQFKLVSGMEECFTDMARIVR